ncbi:hypothetical protein NG895_21180 [Aeoliella sp. ICT_H6.2]|uniref:Uncharacterized protein n=1 Tax=Aeoliella straminimaris TaxID=2954799 RepID=A0A9X2FD56_9BACT|nr:hypothetical protein [Aeoliella straminimaris]MCO6046419.1 hypothetical protein [Aeoliella straminimaris]
MRKFGFCLAVMAALGCGLGCSQETMDKAGDAVEATGDAAESAAEDTVENAEKAVDEMKDAVEGETTDETPAEPAE